MTRLREVSMTAVALALTTSGLFGQAGRPHSAHYLFVAAVDDARALWVNPAGLGVIPEYSVTLDFTLESASTGRLRLGQWSGAVNSRGFGLGYQRDRFADDPFTAEVDPLSTGAYRLGGAVPFGSGAIGASVSMYRGNSVGTEFAGDVGMLLALGPRFSFGAVVQNVGRPVLRATKTAISGTVGVAWYAVPQTLEFAAEGQIVEGLAAANTTVRYRAGIHVSPGRSFPVSVFGAFDLGSDPVVRSLFIGVSLGAHERVGVTGAGVRRAAGLELNEFGAYGIVSRGPERPHP
jgi:hypothetical protein